MRLVTTAESDAHSEHIIKVVFLGDSGVGKTLLLDRIEEAFHRRGEGGGGGGETASIGDIHRNGTTSSTIGVDFKTVRFVDRHQQHFKIQFWDTAGQERFRALIPSYTREAHFAILVFSLISPESFAHLAEWRKLLAPSLPCFLFGNKSDLLHEKEKRLETMEGPEEEEEDEGFFVSDNAIRRFTQNPANSVIHYFQTSARENQIPVEEFLTDLLSHYTRNLIHKSQQRQGRISLVPETKTLSHESSSSSSCTWCG